MSLHDSGLINKNKIKGYILLHYLESIEDKLPKELLIPSSGSGLSSTQAISQRSVQSGVSKLGNQKETVQAVVFVLNIL